MGFPPCRGLAAGRAAVLGAAQALALLVAWAVHADAADSLAGQPGDLLRFGAGAYDVALGRAYTAMASGVSALYYNPAGLALGTRREAGLFHAALAGGASYDYLGYAHPLLTLGGIGVQVVRLGVSGAEGRDEFNQPAGSFDSSEIALSLGTGFRDVVLPGLSSGVGFHYIRRSLGKAQNGLFGLDVGGLYERKRWKLGLSLRDVAGGSHGGTRDEFPFAARLGAAFELARGLTLVADSENLSRFYVGTEYGFWRTKVRIGRSADGLVAMGGGIELGPVSLDLAVMSQSDLGMSQLLSLRYAFGIDRDQRRKEQSQAHLEASAKLNEEGRWGAALAELQLAAKLWPLDEIERDRRERLESLHSLLAFKKEEDEQAFLGAGERARLIRQGVKLHLERDGYNASLLLRQAVATDPTDSRLRGLLDHVEKVNGVKAVVKENVAAEGVLDAKQREVDLAFARRDWAEALRITQELLRLDPNMRSAYVKLGSVYFVMGRVEQAKKAYEKALEMDPNDATLKDFMKRQGW